MRVAGTIKPFDLNGANTGDKIPVGTLVYKVVVVDGGSKAILTGVVTRPGIVTTDGARGKNRVRGLLVVSIDQWNYDDTEWSEKKQEYVGTKDAWLKRYTTASSTVDGSRTDGEHGLNGITYNVGEEVFVKKFDKTTRQCSKGIHVYLTRQGAENH